MTNNTKSINQLSHINKFLFYNTCSHINHTRITKSTRYHVTYSPAAPESLSASLIFLGLPAFGFGGLLPDLGAFDIKCEKISVCFNKNSKRFERSVSILLSKSPSLPLDDVVSLEEPFCSKQIQRMLRLYEFFNTEVNCDAWK